MQLKQRRIGARLRRASERVLEQRRSLDVDPALAIAGVMAAPAAMAAAQPGEWELNSAILFYSEADRVSAIEPVFQASRYFNNDRIFSAKLVVDALTGASANGAVPSQDFQTFTRPSGRGSFTVAPGEVPLDDTFRDTRLALSSSWAQPLAQNLRGSFGLNISKEYDYLSLGASSVLDWDFNKKNTTLTLGLGYAQDQVSPEGDIPTALAPQSYARGNSADEAESNYALQDGSDDAERAMRDSSESKSVIDLLLGVTQVIDRRSLLQVNYSLSLSDGYLTDPFKVVSVVDGSSGAPLSQIYENRPDSRAKHSVFVRGKRAIGDDDVLDLSYRYLFDDWGMTSHTVDMRYRWGLGEWFLQPHLRYYMQSATDFYQGFLIDGQPLPAEVSADYRLGDMQALTAGIEVGRTAGPWGNWRVALEYYRQTPDEPGGKPGALAGLELTPAVDAVMVRFNYDFKL